MRRGLPHPKAFFQVHFWHLVATALLFALAVNKLISDLPLPIPLTGDWLMVIASGLGLSLFIWGFYANK